MKREAERRDKIRVDWQFGILMLLLFLGTFHFARVKAYYPTVVVAVFIIAALLLLNNYRYAFKRNYFGDMLDKLLHLIPIIHLFVAGILHFIDVYNNDIEAIGHIPDAIQFYSFAVVYGVIIGGYHYLKIKDRPMPELPPLSEFYDDEDNKNDEVDAEESTQASSDETS